MIVFRTHAPELVDLYINHPSVRPTMQQGTERLSSEDIVNNRANIVLASEIGCVLFIGEASGVYAGHIAAIEDQRGVLALALGKAALTALFGIYEALTCRAAVPLQLPAARWLVRRLGFTSLGVDPDGMDELFVMEASTWKNY